MSVFHSICRVRGDRKATAPLACRIAASLAERERVCQLC